MNDITYHDTPGAIRAAWQSLCVNGGYALYVDSAGNLQALKLGVEGGE